MNTFPGKLCLAALAVTLLAACGQTGALYLPDERIQTPVEIKPAPAPAPAATPPAEAAQDKPKPQAP
ncbi:MAG: lipoprotein [Steroidobacteraceae bacterium]|nr:lipoprotein [Steroidobacteraceae bacterium]